MTRFAMLMVAVLAFGCSKPTEENCRKAISNMQRLMGTDNLRDEDGVESEVRRCKGGSTRKAVDCAIKAESLDALRACGFFKVPDNAKGIGADPAGSAAGSATGSAAGSAVGSAAGSGAEGAAGAAAGSAAGSAAGTDPANSGSAAPGAAGPGSAADAVGSAAPSGPAKQ